MAYILAIDSGNSYIKWGLYADNLWIQKGKVLYSEISTLKEEFSDLPKPTLIVISHVARAITRSQLDIIVSIWSTRTHWVVAQAFQCDVLNGYANPAQLGSDRWAALIAAWEIRHHACLVINVGTAVTIDALSDSGKFLGGIIMPGMHLMLNSLLSGTQLIKADAGSYRNFPQNTNDAIQSGVIQCLVGAIERMYNLLSLQQDHPVETCIMSGGGASSLIPFIKIPIMIVENLVLDGLVIIANDLRLNKESSF
ncbi:type III pantothenate kinase [Nitrosomonas sp.]|uniref:type III pantothenate kinase n=1 Tax=Nitrosomonas sp. TaxID=42353 RepID=UPI00262783B1|nr:type III pantothenate kinase [Nitrosomonas sp.]